MIEIRPFDFTRDWTHYCGLHHRARGRAVDQAFIKWRYFDNPAGRPIAFGSWDKESLVGFAALIPQRFWVKGEEHISGLGEDMVAPGHDREEIVARLTERLLEDMKDKGWLWSYRVATKKDAEVYLNRLGHTMAAEMPCWSKIRKWRLVKKWLGFGGKTKETAGFRMAYHSYRVRMVREFDERFDRLWERCRSEYPVSVVKDSKYLKWRYLDRPDGQHQILTVEDQGRLKGFAVLAGGELLELFCEVDTDAYKTLVKATEKVWKIQRLAISQARILGNGLLSKALKNKGWHKYRYFYNYLRNNTQRFIITYSNNDYGNIAEVKYQTGLMLVLGDFESI